MRVKKKGLWKIVGKEKGRDLLLLLVFLFVFWMLFFLYELPMEPYIYGAALTMLLFFVVNGLEGFHLIKRHRAMQSTYQNLPLLSEDFVQPETLCEADLMEILLELERILNDSTTKWKEKECNAIDFYTTWVHQIKTPVSVLRMILQKEDTKQNRALLLEVFRIEQYIEMVLSYLRLDHASSDFVFKQYKLDSILKSVIHKFAPQFVEKKIALSYEPTNLTVLTDEKWLSFLIEQVFSNALKYTKEGGKISIYMEADQTLTISDTGIGIAPEDLPRIFEKGFTGYNGRTDKKATGLGLYLCKETAKKLSHRIAAKSVVGKGTAISITFLSNSMEMIE